jgi:phage terminase large subunit-like protein
VIGAASRDQATILFTQAAGLVERSKLTDLFDVKGGYRHIRLRANPSARIRVLAADANTADGVIPTLALVDELHRHPSAELYGVFRDGLGPRHGQMLTISTAGANLDSPLGALRSAAYKLERFERDDKAKRTHAISDDGSFVLHEWCLDPEDDPTDMRLVKKANPASWQTVKGLAQRHDSPSTTPWQWLRFACGVWTEGEEPWIDPRAWDALADPEREIPEGAPAWLGVDLGVRHDSTAIGIAFMDTDGTVIVRAEIMKPEGVLPIERVEAKIREVAARYTVQAIAYDPWSFRRSAEMLEADGLPMREYTQSAEKMSIASASLYRVIDGGLLRHDGDPVLRSHVLSGVTKETERGWRLVKDPRSRRSIDALIALTMAVQMATETNRAPTPMIAFV